MWRNDIRLEGDDFRKIDAHSHIQELDYPFNVSITPEEFIDLMDAYRIEKAIISDIDNEKILDVVKEHEDKFIGIYWVNPRSRASVEEMKKFLEKHEFRGIKLHPLLHMYSPTDPRVYEVMKIAEDFSVHVQIHSGHPPTSLPWQIGELAKKFPEVRVVMVHMGHGNAFYIQAAIEVANGLENIFLETSGMPMPAKIRQAYEVAPKRVVFGIDLPCHHPVVEIAKVLTSGLDKDAIERVFYKNAKVLL
ncbi:amidohydrolase family protein [Pyrococcus sp. ST04]|uniref:amidohydrolase family protein n=1 Tax=Pyrococcus sp. ST04 TaxID=1183377 RepID=UPI0002605960|nr:putative metal-dependent hydrolase [Pyrococcus sp. ST04]